MCNAVDQIIHTVIRIQEAGRGQFLDQFAVIRKLVHLVAVFLDDPVALTTIAVCIEIIFTAIDGCPSLLVVARTIMVFFTIFRGLPDTGGQFTGLFKGITDIAPFVCSNRCTLIVFPEVMPLAIDQLPAGTQLAIDGIAVCIYACIQEQTAVLRLTDVNTIFAKVVVITVYQLDTGFSHACSIVSIALSLGNPAIFHSAISIEFILALFQQTVRLIDIVLASNSNKGTIEVIVVTVDLK